MNDEELLKYYYEELIMSLITMSLPAEEQKDIIGIGCLGDEMLNDFDDFYRMRRQTYIDNKVFDGRQLKILDEFNEFLDKFNGQNEDFYWDIEELKNNPLWAALREEAKKVVTNVFGKNYKIEIQRENKLENGRVVLEHTKRKLIEVCD
ncbi:MAG: hypothetical protein ACM3UU_12100 [Ignavibacteriales bacterium]